MHNSASEIIAIHKKNGGDIANFGAPSDYDHLYVITQGDLTLAYAARGGKCLVEISKKEFNKRQKHADIEHINVSLDSDAALLPPYLPGFRPSPSLRFCRNSCVPAAVRRNGKASTGRLLYLTAGSRTVSFVQLGRVMTLQIMQS